MDEELPRVTPGMLRKAGSMCPRRLAHEHGTGKKLTSLGSGGFEVSNRIQHAATTGSADPTLPLEQAFVDPEELDPEQRALYRAAAKGYVTHFAGSQARSEELPWETEVTDLGVRLVGPVGVALRDEDGTAELRILRFGASRLVDDVDMHFAVLRAGAWAGEHMRVVVVDLIENESVQYDVDVAEKHATAAAWLRERVELIRERADRDVALPGEDCRSCTCIPGCPKLTRDV